MKMKMLQQKKEFHTEHRCMICSAFILTSVVFLLAYITAVTLCHVFALQAEISALREELGTYGSQRDHLQALMRMTKGMSTNWNSSVNQVSEFLERNLSNREKSTERKIKFRGSRSLPEQVQQSCLQLIAMNDQMPLMKANDCPRHFFGKPQPICKVERRFVLNKGGKQETAIPWILSLKRGDALDKEGNKISVKETGYFLVYSQVWYKDNTFTMGHFIQRRRASSVGNEPRTVILFRCIQNMSACCPNSSCFTAGIAKLEVGDELELVIPRTQAQIALTGDGTFFGAIELL
ncbi:tumor necrosis factor ligand superfamily member 13B-like [Pristis pectinata]|uniref:tumor necrosis factor ligand superfamily member 13B-like n=1 Tax=Pristis pectinata TaxID=685728 RepID=UPI00223DA21C|nr:tumor necrosis factor ligand superfamily member 13B-like [Pristis pectinata]